MKGGVYRTIVSCGALLCLLLFFGISQAAPPEKVTIKLEGAKMAPVTFSHTVHVDKNKLECKVCHHKDADSPKACTTCHDVKEVKDKAPAARDAFHNRCQGCHKQKGGSAPTKCNECHKK